MSSINFDDLATDFDNIDQAPVAALTGTYLERASNFASTGRVNPWAKPATNKPVIACPKCRGTGVWVSFSGYTRSTCFKCNGEGKVLGLMQDAASVKAREQAAARREAKKADEQAAKGEWLVQHMDVTVWVAVNAPTFDFAASLQEAFIARGTLTEGQVVAVRRCIEREQARKAERQAATAAKPQAPGLDLSSLPEGYYAVPGGETRLKVRIKKPASGKWAGFTFVSDGAAYGEATRYGMQAPGKMYRGQIEAQLAAIIANPEAASAAYGMLTGQCGVCNRPLEDAVSVARGIGPICAAKKGWILKGVDAGA